MPIWCHLHRARGKGQDLLGRVRTVVGGNVRWSGGRFLEVVKGKGHQEIAG